MNFIRRIEEFPIVEEIPKVHRRAICGDNVMIALINYEPGATVEQHCHASEQIIYVLEGRMWLKVGDEEGELEKGSVAVIPSHMPHSTKALEKTTFLEAFHPIRLSYLVGYMGPTDTVFETNT